VLRSWRRGFTFPAQRFRFPARSLGPPAAFMFFGRCSRCRLHFLVFFAGSCRLARTLSSAPVRSGPSAQWKQVAPWRLRRPHPRAKEHVTDSCFCYSAKISSPPTVCHAGFVFPTSVSSSEKVFCSWISTAVSKHASSIWFSRTDSVARLHLRSFSGCAQLGQVCLLLIRFAVAACVCFYGGFLLMYRKCLMKYV
jgi:hypothetical protein